MLAEYIEYVQLLVNKHTFLKRVVVNVVVIAAVCLFLSNILKFTKTCNKKSVMKRLINFKRFFLVGNF